MERINFPQVAGQSDLLDPNDPGQSQVNVVALLEELEEEYKNRV
ncbi:MAG TPA: hypothetical protein PKA10_05130 [Selenomonadales bacterium]|nr:hypothetical protein [Selenomonadales bacterium]